MAAAAGCGGMCAGQYLDIKWEGRALDGDDLSRIDGWKTGALLEAACLLGLTASPVEPAPTPEELGKPVGSDAENGKSTYAACYGLDKCRELVAELTEQAKRSVTEAFAHPEFLCALADSLAKRIN